MTAAVEPLPEAREGFVPAALPFWLSLAYVPALTLSGWFGGWWLLAPSVFTLGIVSLGDKWLGRERRNPTVRAAPGRLVWHEAITLAWLPLQLAAIFGTLVAVFGFERLGPAEAIAAMANVGLVTGTVGITYAHELMHRRGRLPRALGEALMVSTLYGHFVTEHLRVHHRYVGTPRDSVTARYNEGLWAFVARVVPGSLASAWAVEADLMRRRGKPGWSLRNPFWRYGLGALAMLALAAWIGGAFGVLLFGVQAAVAVLMLETANYVEHYGLTRRHLGGGQYEHTRPHHSWNAEQRVSNWLLINLQRHSDHHFKPERPFPLLQTYDEAEAPTLPHGYPWMVVVAFYPPAFRRYMNHRVRKWRAAHYPDIEDWSDYDRGRTPMPGTG